MSDKVKQPLLAAILLAAGPSSRLGKAKQLVRLGEECLVRRSARLLLGLDPESIVVVTGFEADRINAELQDLPLRTTHNLEWEQGMGGSIACGAKSIPRGIDGILIMACDQWRLDQEDLRRLYSAWKTDISRIAVAAWKEGRAFISGPPVIFPGPLIHELRFINKSRGARQVIDRHMEIVEFVKMSNAAFDLDRPEDLEQLLQEQVAEPQ